MNKQVFMAAFICCTLGLIAIVPAYAQMPGTEIHARIPFDFIVRGKTLPAGAYRVRRVNDSPEGLVIQNEGTHQTAIVETDPLESGRIPSKAKLVFHRYGDDYFLAQVWTPGSDTGREVIPSHRERRLSRELVRNDVQPKTVIVAAY
jgi:hypothetical protein